MRISKPKSKRSPAIPGEPISKEEFAAFIKEGEKGPFKPIGNLVEEIKLQYKKNNTSKAKKNQFNPENSFTKEEFIALVKEGEKGPFYSHEKLIRKFNLWKKSLKK